MMNDRLPFDNLTAPLCVSPSIVYPMTCDQRFVLAGSEASAAVLAVADQGERSALAVDQKLAVRA
jgi:hypothetical protein